MRRLDTVLILSSVVLLAGCEAAGNADGANEATVKRSSATRVSQPAIVTLPEGATFALVLDTPLSSETSAAGDRVVAKLAEDVRVGEKVVVPAGSEVRGQVTAAVPSGRVKGDARLAFDFDTLVLKGKEHAIAARAIDITAANQHKRDAAIIGIGAGAGAIIGAIVDGGKGAGIGGLIGGATGTGVVLRNKGKEVELGAGSRMTVELTQETRL